MRKLLISSVISLLSAASATAVRLTDDFDDFPIVWSLHGQSDVVEFRQKFDDFRKKLYLHNEQDLIALFGKSRAEMTGAYEVPVAEDTSGPGMFHGNLNRNSAELNIT